MVHIRPSTQLFGTRHSPLPMRDLIVSMEKQVLFVVILRLLLWVIHALDNPFEQGCLLQKVPGWGWTKSRVCNSDDRASDACRRPDLDYMEIRIFSENWESVFFES